MIVIGNPVGLTRSTQILTLLSCGLSGHLQLVSSLLEVDQHHCRLLLQNAGLFFEGLPLPFRNLPETNSEDRDYYSGQNGGDITHFSPRYCGLLRAIIEIVAVVIGYGLAGLAGGLGTDLLLSERIGGWQCAFIFVLGGLCAAAALIWAVCDAVACGA
ncbi:MAG TPA: hypothetical protein VNU74_02985 [Terriglobales bacterium]|nr:hypothetical protein [Terriglobales bacterium]